MRQTEPTGESVLRGGPCAATLYGRSTGLATVTLQAVGSPPSLEMQSEALALSTFEQGLSNKMHALAGQM